MKTKNSTKTKNSKENNARLNILCGLACDRLNEVLDKLGVRLRKSGKCYAGRCPVHGGKSLFGLNLYTDGYAARGNWVCNSDKCHHHFGTSFIGFVTGVLSHSRHGWEKRGDPEVDKKEAIDILCGILGVKLQDITVKMEEIERSAFNKDIELFTAQYSQLAKELCTRKQYHQMVDIPAEYYLKRGYSEATLREFEVGVCKDERSKNFGRIIIPIYDNAYEKIIGAVTRSLSPTCPNCKLCHKENKKCPDGPDRMNYLRWKNIGNFNDKMVMYNYWRAKKNIYAKKSIVIVEGAGDVWRLEEAGVKNAVGLFGSRMTEAQVSLLQESLVNWCYVLTDNNEAGNQAAKQIMELCGSYINVRRVLPVGKDEVGDMSVDEIKKHLLKEFNR